MRSLLRRTKRSTSTRRKQKPENQTPVPQGVIFGNGRLTPSQIAGQALEHSGGTSHGPDIWISEGW
jgi:hypothetical protein